MIGYSCTMLALEAEGEFDGNPNTIGDPTWQPLVNTPPYPEYTSGANSVTGAATKA